MWDVIKKIFKFLENNLSLSPSRRLNLTRNSYEFFDGSPTNQIACFY